ncbi:hypothetical protein CROQUDRAFT_102180 [Cronartium quercuum f. sp. fusiforme G11]|uniref:Uncharacterized protein n=1 Tax=Cronartium quercuum f. sp. fusiforme G11 TaxID=708437 RepID=A0A9P6N839_9BASI|nr:hypothetical protein CROQUDRAFT_102180 [Cronartium quercuum f. sp. fusiforme G11]
MYYGAFKKYPPYPTEEQSRDFISTTHHKNIYSKFFIQEGKLSIGQAGEIFDALEDWFEAIKVKWIENLKEMFPNDQKKVDDTISYVTEKLFCHLVLGFLGGLKMMYYGSGTKMSTKVLMQEGSKYLQVFMLPWKNVRLESILNTQKQGSTSDRVEWFHTENVLTHLFMVDKSVPYISHTLIVYMLGDWASKHNEVSHIITDTNPFQENCFGVFFQKTGVTLNVKLELLGKDYKPPVNSRNAMIQLRELKDTKKSNIDKVSGCQLLFDFLSRVGKDYGKQFDELVNQMDTFFKQLKSTLIAQYHEQNASSEQIRSPSEYLESQECLNMISKAIDESRHMVPAFVGILALLNQDQKVPSGLKNLLLHGCSFFQEYFSQWKQLNMKNGDKAGIYNLEREAFKGRNDFQSPRRTMQLFMAPNKQYWDYQFVWYLAQLWYDSVLYQPFDQSGASAFNVMLLDGAKLQDVWSDSLRVAESKRRRSHS